MRTFTEEEVNQIVKMRLERDRARKATAPDADELDRLKKQMAWTQHMMMKKLVELEKRVYALERPKEE